jgi:multidrug efflux pump subunit AcrA (membrane-fusion protein)
MKWRHSVVSLVSLAGVGIMTYTVISSEKALPPAPPVAEPAKPPFQTFISGAGLVEARSENIGVGTELPGVVARVLVKVGDQVQASQPLFALDSRQASAEVAVQEGNLRVAQGNLAKLKALPRKEEVPVAVAQLAEAQALAADARQQLQRAEALQGSAAFSREELQRRRNVSAAAEARAVAAKAALELLTAGAWKQDLTIAEAQVIAAGAQLNAARTQLDRLTIRAPVAGEILQVNVRPGEYLSTVNPAPIPPIVMGDTSVLHVRVDIDENDAWRLKPGTQAVANLRGNAAIKTTLQFVRTEPYVIPKRSLTGGSNERVDTRVLQVLYAFKRGELPIFVGQQMDVFIEAAPDSVAQVMPR